MRIAELSHRTGVPVPTIKYYLREGLLPPGELTSPNQARYDESHVHRVRLIRALVEVGGLTIAAAREVVEVMHADDRTPFESIGKVHYAVLPRSEAAESPAAADLIERRGWRVRPTNPARAALSETLAHLELLGHPDAFGLVDAYADAADRLAEVEIAALAEHAGVDGMAESVVALSVLGTALLAALRGLAQESAATDRFREP
jgi:DNA-binding transcriptional MerR regulator